MNISKMEMGEIISARRTEVGLTQQGLADKMCGGYENLEGSANIQRKISSWENGKSFPKVDDFMTLCDALDCDPQYLCGEIDTPRRETRTVMEITGLGKKAAESLLGICKYDIQTRDALELLLTHEDAWEFGAARKDDISGINVLSSAGHYLSNNTSKLALDTEKGTVHLSSTDSFSAVNGAGYPVKPLIERTQLDAIIDALKAIKKTAPGD